MEKDFSKLLKQWRTQLGFSQQAFSSISGISTKHLSYLETAKSMPSMQMVGKISSYLGLSDLDKAVLYRSAGFSDNASLKDSEQQLQQMFKAMLDAHDPYPALISNQYLELLQANSTALAVIEWLDLDLSRFDTALDCLFSAKGLRPYIENWEEALGHVFQVLKARDIELSKPTPFHKSLRYLLSDKSLMKIWQANQQISQTSVPRVTLRLAYKGEYLSFNIVFSTLGSLNHLNALGEVYQLNYFYPDDEVTKNWLERQQYSQ